MPSDEELRKVAEDLRALARSLARDVWDATQSARDGRPPGEALKHGIKDAVHGARRELRDEMRRHVYRAGRVPPGYGRGRSPNRGAGRHGHWPGTAGPQPGYPGSGYPGSGYPGSGYPGSAYPGPRRPPRNQDRNPLPPVRRRWDASVLAGTLIVVFGLAWLLGGLGAVHLSTEAVLAGGLMVLGAALMITARTDWSLSRHSWPVIVGVALVAGLFATSTSFGVTGALSHFSFGNMTSSPTHSQTVYGGFGQLEINASRLASGSTLRIQSIAGETQVILPADKTATVQGHVLAGQVCVNGQRYASGIGASSAPVPVPAADGNPTGAVTIDIHQLAGQIVVGQGGCLR